MRTKLVLTAVSILVVAAGCGDDRDDGIAATATSDGGADTVEVVAVDYAYEGLPDTVAVGTKLALRNEAGDEVHELIAYRLPDGEQRSPEEILALPEDEIGALFAGPPNLGLVALPGGAGTAVAGDGTLSEAGRYLVFCAIPTGASVADVQAAMAQVEETDGPPEIAGGPPHFTAGMFADIEVR